MKIKDRPLAIENPENICFKCLDEFDNDNLTKIHIPSMGYGSGFDGWSTKVHLCSECIKKTNLEWWKLEEVQDEGESWIEWYKYEDDIFKYIKTLPVQSRELFWNRYSTDSYQMEAQDWIDYELDILPHEKCKEYGRYSPQEIKAYNERFPICKHVKIKEYDDRSKSSSCFMGAYGDDEGNAGLDTYDDCCYTCGVFALREGEIMSINLKDEEIKRTKEQIAILHKKLQELEK